MLNRLCVITNCLIATILICLIAPTAHAQVVEITNQNIGQFFGIRNESLGTIACYVSQVDGGVGQVWSENSKKPHLVKPGATFRALSPSIQERFDKLSKEINTLSKKLKRSKGESAKGRLRKHQ